MAIHEGLYKRLIEVAKDQQTITYSELAPMLGLNMSSAGDRTRIGDILGEISTQEVLEGRPMLSVLVVLSGEGVPGTGFYNLASDLGKHKSGDDFDFFVKELKRVHIYWSGDKT